MAVFSVNQNRQLYVANAYKAKIAGTDPAGTISVKADKAKKCFYFPYVGADNLMRSDLIDVDKVMYAKATDADTLAKFEHLPENLKSACSLANNSDFIKEHIPGAILELYCNK